MECCTTVAIKTDRELELEARIMELEEEIRSSLKEGIQAAIRDDSEIRIRELEDANENLVSQVTEFLEEQAADKEVINGLHDMLDLRDNTLDVLNHQSERLDIILDALGLPENARPEQLTEAAKAILLGHTLLDTDILTSFEATSIVESPDATYKLLQHLRAWGQAQGEDQ